VTGAVYQPLALGARSGLALTVGAVVSTLTVADAVPVLPARSVQVALSVRVPSPLLVLLVVQRAGSIPSPPAGSV